MLPIDMPQTITHVLPTGQVTTPRLSGESTEAWLLRHRDAINAATE